MINSFLSLNKDNSNGQFFVVRSLASDCVIVANQNSLCKLRTEIEDYFKINESILYCATTTTQFIFGQRAISSFDDTRHVV